MIANKHNVNTLGNLLRGEANARVRSAAATATAAYHNLFHFLFIHYLLYFLFVFRSPRVFSIIIVARLSAGLRGASYRKSNNYRIGTNKNIVFSSFFLVRCLISSLKCKYSTQLKDITIFSPLREREGESERRRRGEAEQRNQLAAAAAARTSSVSSICVHTTNTECYYQSTLFSTSPRCV